MDAKDTPWWKAFCEQVSKLPDGSEVQTVELSSSTWAEPVTCHGKFSMEYPQMQNLPKCKVLLHPIMRNYWSIAIVEQATGRTAVIRNGYIELVKA